MRIPEIPLGDAIETVVYWSRTNASLVFDTLNAFISLLIDSVQTSLNLLPWWAVLLLAGALAYWARGWKFALFTLAGLTLIEGMRLWTQSMDTLALAIVATGLCAVIGVPVGILAARSSLVSGLVKPVLDFMQTLPAFVYLIPAIFFFGVGLVPAVVATVVFAAAPLVRLVELGIRQVDGAMVEAATAFGAKRSQVLREVQLPLAFPTIMAGINQAIMMSLAMVVIAGMVGAGGLGAVVLRGITQLDIAVGFEGGIAVVFVAIFLDRFTSAFPRSKVRKRVREAETEVTLS